ncbi:MAG: hypothetical protein RJB13_158, partial [Pseudomonadota bacterium]
TVLKLIIFTTASAFASACDLPPVKTIYENPTGLGSSSRATSPAVSADDSTERSNGTSAHWIEINKDYDTVFKIRADDSSTLSKTEKCNMPRGTRHTLAKEPVWMDSHAKITLEKTMTGCDFQTGWIYVGHIGASSDKQPPMIKKTHTGVATLYTTENTAMEGGPLDRCGRKLNTLDDYMNWKANEVSVAMDRLALPYGTLIRIPAIEKRLNVADPIPFRIVDTGSAFKGKGLSRLDICVGHSQDTIYSSKYVWMSHASFEYEIIKLGDTFLCN